MIRHVLKKANIWKWFDRYGDPYPLIRPFLFMMDPEDAHDLTMKMLSYGLGPQFFDQDDPILRTTVFGLDFSNPLCLGAGLDKQASHMDAFLGFGFGAVEIGTVTPKPQSGNPRPRMFRVPQAKALINRFGFNSVGADVFVERLKSWREAGGVGQAPLGINIGKNKETSDDAADYKACFEKVAPYADFVTINISSPNTPGLRDLQGRERMTSLIESVASLREKIAPKCPLLVKIAPDLTEAQQDDIAAVACASRIQALIVSNTTLARPSTIPDALARESGGLSGPPLFGPSTRLLSALYQKTGGRVPLIGCGGVNNGSDAYKKIRAGASLVQIYTALVFEGPLVVQKMKRELAGLLRRDGFSCLSDAIGADHR